MIARSAALMLALGTTMTLTTATALAQDANTVRLLAANCANCHGTDGKSQGGVPTLAGQAKSKLSQDLHEFKAGQRPATIMHQIAKGYTDAEIDALAGYFATQK